MTLDPITLDPMAEQVLHYLTAARAENTVTPARPISGARLAARFGLGGSAEVRALIHELRSQGEWIGATDKGYFLCVTWDEAAQTVRALERRARAIYIPAQAMKARAGKNEQLSL